MPNGYSWNGYGNPNRPMMQSNMYGNSQPYLTSYGQQMGMNQSQQMMQQQQPPQQPSYIPGRVIAQESDIVPNEVPNDGNFAVFVQQDLSTIYAKTWGGDGLIKTNVYKLVPQEVSGEETKEDGVNPMDLILERLDNIEKMVKNNNRYQKPYNKKPYVKQEKKEDENHG